MPARIVAATDLPVSVDFEGAYSTDPNEGARNMARLAATGAVGCNFEDQVIGGEGLHPLDLQCRRIAAAREAVGAAFFINARTDLFLKVKDHDEALADQAIERAQGASPTPARAASSCPASATSSWPSGSAAPRRSRSTPSLTPAPQAAPNLPTPESPASATARSRTRR